MTGAKGLSLKKFLFVDAEGLVRLVMSAGAEHKLACASARTMVGQCPGEGSGNKAVEEEGSNRERRVGHDGDLKNECT